MLTTNLCTYLSGICHLRLARYW